MKRLKFMPLLSIPARNGPVFTSAPPTRCPTTCRTFHSLHNDCAAHWLSSSAARSSASADRSSSTACHVSMDHLRIPYPRGAGTSADLARGYRGPGLRASAGAAVGSTRGGLAGGTTAVHPGPPSVIDCALRRTLVRRPGCSAELSFPGHTFRRTLFASTTASKRQTLRPLGRRLSEEQHPASTVATR